MCLAMMLTSCDRWEKEEGQWRSYPLNDSIELDRYWQVFAASGNEASCISEILTLGCIKIGNPKKGNVGAFPILG